MAKIALDTSALPSGDASDRLVVETMSDFIGSRVWTDSLLQRVRRVPSASAFLQTSHNADASAAAVGENNASTESDMTFTQTRKVLVTARSMQSISAELLADTDVLRIVSEQMAGAITRYINGQIALAVSEAVWLTGAHRRGTTTGNASLAQMASIIFGTDTTTESFSAGQRFSASQRKDLVLLANGASIGELAGTPVNGVPPSLWTSSEGTMYYFGLPLIAVEELPMANVGGTVAHWLCVDASKIVLASQPLVVSIDEESGAQNNLVTVHASMRFAAFLSHNSHATALSLSAIPA